VEEVLCDVLVEGFRVEEDFEELLDELWEVLCEVLFEGSFEVEALLVDDFSVEDPWVLELWDTVSDDLTLELWETEPDPCEEDWLELLEDVDTDPLDLILELGDTELDPCVEDWLGLLEDDETETDDDVDEDPVLEEEWEEECPEDDDTGDDLTSEEEREEEWEEEWEVECTTEEDDGTWEENTKGEWTEEDVECLVEVYGARHMGRYLISSSLQEQLTLTMRHGRRYSIHHLEGRIDIPEACDSALVWGLKSWIRQLLGARDGWSTLFKFGTVEAQPEVTTTDLERITNATLRATYDTEIGSTVDQIIAVALAVKNKS
jgi:hypothetical protein